MGERIHVDNLDELADQLASLYGAYDSDGIREALDHALNASTEPLSVVRETEVVEYATRAPKAVLTAADGRRQEYGTIITWWEAELVVHAYRPYHPREPRTLTHCGWPAGSMTVPLGHALKVARPCKVCWKDDDDA